ncbi:hypothetical protein UPYG_G00300430 [Umbra pygmaea]|uniref:Integrase core domain-containing protein n=1 Tax=Umbra pygmaea TaxID=75934 RepID=A0ABD0W7W6_UMBPY
MARILGCSTSYLYKKSRMLGVSLQHRFTTVGEDELEQHIRRLHQQYPNSGSKMMQGYLRVEGIIVQRAKVREMLTRVDPIAAAQRWSNVVARRTYHVPFPNSLWHIDGHMRLIRWGFVTHAVQSVFGEDPYTEENLEAMLGRYGIQLTQLQAQADNDDLARAVIIEQPLVNLTAEQEQAVQDSLTDVTDLKLRYLTCCRMLSELGIGQ